MSIEESEKSLWDRITPREINYFSLLIYDHFNGRPYHARTVRQEWNLHQVRNELGDQLVRSDIFFDPDQQESQREYIHRLLVRLDNDVFCHFFRDEMVVYAPTAAMAIEVGNRLSQRFAKPPSKSETPAFYLLTVTARGLGTKRVKVEPRFVMSEQDLELHYGPDGMDFERKLTGTLECQTGGTTILRGPAGTGKTSFIRHLIGKLCHTHRFYFLPVSGCRFLAAPDMVEFWLNESRSAPGSKRIVVLEDAEDILMQRAGDNREKVSALLNVADGLLGDLLRMHLLCTVNCALDKLDQAVVRPGRLLAYREFPRLGREQARRIAAAKGITLSEQEDYALAEIYRQPVLGGESRQTTRQVGFTA